MPARLPARLRLALLIGPALLVTLGLCFGGLGVALARSLQGPGGGVTLAAWRAILADPGFLRALGLTLYVAGVSTVLALALGTAAALLLRQRFRGRGAVAFLAQLNLTVPHVVGALGILYLFGQSGLVARLAWHAGLIAAPAEFPALVNDPWAVGVILHYVWKEVPFVALIVLAQMQALGPDWEAVARSLGARPWQAFRQGLLPLLQPALAAAGAIVFAFACGAYEVPLLLGASHPEALPVLAFRHFTDVDLGQRPQAMAMAVVIAALAAAGVAALLRLGRLPEAAR